MHVNKVVKSLETEDGLRCVDIFSRPDGSFGFEEYRRDPEDPNGWRPINNNEGRVFADPEIALEAARKQVAWLSIQIRS